MCHVTSHVICDVTCDMVHVTSDVIDGIADFRNSGLPPSALWPLTLTINFRPKKLQEAQLLM